MTTRMRPRPRRRVDPFAKSRDEYLIHGPNGQTRTARYAHDRLALVEAQALAEHAKAPLTLTVERRALVGRGAPVQLFRVTRDKRGVVYTRTLD